MAGILLRRMRAEPDAIPDPLYVFVNQASFWTRHNFNLTGCFVSAGFGAAVPEAVPAGTTASFISTSFDQSTARDRYTQGTLDYRQFIPNPDFCGWPTPFGAGVTDSYRMEYDCEGTRLLKYRYAPSRLSAVYAFGDYASCQIVNANHGWPLTEVERFRLDDHELNRVWKTNMEIVTLARYGYPRGMWDIPEIEAIWSSYWEGRDELELEIPIDGVNFERRTSGCIWEYLVEGVLSRI